MSLKFILAFLCAIFVGSLQNTWYEPIWESLDKRPTPAWLNEAKIGIWMHWGVYSVPSISDDSYAEFLKKNYPPGFKYEDFAPQFTAEFFNATQWARQFQKSGAKFVVLTAKHGDGYALWPSKYSPNWNSVDVGPRRDLIGELADALRRNTDIKFGFQYMLSELPSYNSLFLADEASGFKTNNYMKQKMLPEITDLIEKYKTDLLLPYVYHRATPQYWKATELLAWIYNNSTVKDTIAVFPADIKNVIYGIPTPYSYKIIILDQISYSFRRDTNIEELITTQQMIEEIVKTISGGTILFFNFGPTKEGTITPIYQEMLNNMGEWLHINGEAIYGTKPWTQQIDSNKFTYHTTKGNVVYAMSTQWPKNNKLVLKYVTKLFFKSSTYVTLLGGNGKRLEWQIKGDTIELLFPDKSTVNTNWAYVVKIQT